LGNWAIWGQRSWPLGRGGLDFVSTFTSEESETEGMNDDIGVNITCIPDESKIGGSDGMACSRFWAGILTAGCVMVGCAMGSFSIRSILWLRDIIDNFYFCTYFHKGWNGWYVLSDGILFSNRNLSGLISLCSKKTGECAPYI
jgi:hypothetical protein